MVSSYPDLPEGAAWGVTRIYYPAQTYHHPASGLLQLRLIRRGSSYADIDLGHGIHKVFTRPGDLLLSLPDRPTTIKVSEGRDLTLLQIDPKLAEQFLSRAGGRTLEDLRPLSRRPVREPLVAELVGVSKGRTLGSGKEGTGLSA